MPPSPDANGIARRYAVSFALPGNAERVYADDRAERRVRVLPMVVGVVPAAAVAEPDVQQPVVFGGCVCAVGLNAMLPMLCQRPNWPTRRTSRHVPSNAFVRRVARRPLVDYAFLIFAALFEIVGDAAVRSRAERSVELAVAGLARFAELRMKRESKQPRFIREGVVVEVNRASCECRDTLAAARRPCP